MYTAYHIGIFKSIITSTVKMDYRLSKMVSTEIEYPTKCMYIKCNKLGTT
jgi:hypothetical protein